MAGFDGGEAGASARRLSLEGTLLRAALLAREGPQARALAARLARACRPEGGRSCFEAGAPLQITVDAPGKVELRVGLRLGARLDATALRGLVPETHTRRLQDSLARLPDAEHPSLGHWLFWSRKRQSVFVDLRDPEPARALARLRQALEPHQRRRLEGVVTSVTGARPWGLKIEADDEGLRRVHLYWLVGRGRPAAELAEAVCPGRWARVVDVLGHLLSQPGHSGRWLMATPLDDRSPPALRVGNSGWTLVPEDERKHRAVGRLMSALGGPRDYAEAMWSLCRGAAGPRFRVGRTCEVRVDDEGARARLFFTPQVGADSARSDRGDE